MGNKLFDLTKNSKTQLPEQSKLLNFISIQLEQSISRTESF